jgi:ADP-ribose pyrophosphatase YjhB (NUDIX family)
MIREYPTHPIVGVGMIVQKDNRIVLVKREREPGKGKWSIPGGMLELGERISEGVKREILEETGLIVEIDRLIDVEENIGRDATGKIRFHYVLIDFLGHVVNGNLTPDTDVKEAIWVDLSQVDTFRITNTLKRLLLKANLCNS